MIRNRFIAVPLLAASATVLAACTSPAAHKTSPPQTTPQTTATATASSIETTEAATTEPELTGKEACQILHDTTALQSAEGFIIVAGVLNPSDVDETVGDLQSAKAQAPIEFQTALDDIISALQNLDQAITDGTGETVDTSAVQPDANLLAGMCRSRHFPIPAT